ncbi:MAG TPA: extracellular solute-binding protein, partial [Polyangiaceae bacterium]|nr:extracellular solute-binding protein [Polyangiaceae bacterium]
MIGLLGGGRAEAAEPLTVWSAYSGREELGLRAAIAAYQRSQPGLEVKLLSIPFGAYLAKLEAAIPAGNGPDLFVDSHERMPELAARDLLEPWPDTSSAEAEFPRAQLDSLSNAGKLLGLPLSLKSLALYVNTALVPNGEVSSTDELESLRASLPTGTYPLVFEAENPYYASAALHAFGGALLSKTGDYAFVGAPAERTLELLTRWTRAGVVPEAPSGDLVKRLFATGKAATAISGPWLAADLPPTLAFRIQTLPRLSEASGADLLPFVTIEAAFVSRHTPRENQARALAAFLAGEAGARIRAEIGGQVVALASIRENSSDPRLRAFARAAALGVPMPVHPRMHAVWEPAGRALQSALRGGTPARVALASAAAMFARNTRPAPAKAQPAWLLGLLGLVTLWGAFSLLSRARNADFRRSIARSLPAYRYLLLTTTAVVALVIVPLGAGVLISFFSGRGRDFTYV